MSSHSPNSDSKNSTPKNSAPRAAASRGFDLDAHLTGAVHGGLRSDPATGALLTPIYQSTTYRQDAVGVHKGHTYSRASNPTVSALEEALGSLEDTPPAVCFATGMAAISAVFLALLKSGDHVVLSDVVYGGTVRLFDQVLGRLGIESSFVDTASPAAVKAAIRPTTRMVFIETPANPTLKLTDVEAMVAITRPAGLLLVVDNTFLTPVLLRPLDLGADITMLSTTKYIEGHTATVGGSIASRDERILDRLRLIRKTLGSIQSPHEAWLTARGIKTLPLRLQQHSRGAQVVAEWLEQHPDIAHVHYPGLASFPQRELAERQHSLHGGMLSFELKQGAEAGIALMNAGRLCVLAENLGAAKTLITHPVSMTHGDVPREMRERIGITDGLVRLSVGLEDPRDIIADLSQALDVARSSESVGAYSSTR